MIYTTQYQSPLGEIFLAEKEGALIGLRLEGQTHRERVLTNGHLSRETEVLTQSKYWLDRYFAGEKPGIEQLTLAPAGSPFQLLVWSLLCQIPYGQVTTYGEIARKVAALLGKEKMSAQAVGGAVGKNPISVIVPCHRVIGADGSLTGYNGGIHLKEKLLALEEICLPADRLFAFE